MSFTRGTCFNGDESGQSSMEQDESFNPPMADHVEMRTRLRNLATFYPGNLRLEQQVQNGFVNIDNQGQVFSWNRIGGDFRLDNSYKPAEGVTLPEQSNKRPWEVTIQQPTNLSKRTVDLLESEYYTKVSIPMMALPTIPPI